jgi:hypothetical protein
MLGVALAHYRIVNHAASATRSSTMGTKAWMASSRGSEFFAVLAMASESKKADGKEKKDGKDGKADAPTGSLDAGDIALLTTYVRSRATATHTVPPPICRSVEVG